MGSAEAWEVVGYLLAPPGPVVGDVVAPQVEFVGNALVAEDSGGRVGRGERACRVGLPGALADDEDDVDAVAQPLQVVSTGVLQVVDRVVEVCRVAAFAPAVPRRRVVVARLADRLREQV